MHATTHERAARLTFLMKATEKVSQETMPWSMSSTKAVRVKDSRSPKLQDNTQMIGNVSLAVAAKPRWLGTWRGMSSQQRQREVGAAEEERGQKNVSSMLHPDKYEGGEVCDAVQTNWRRHQEAGGGSAAWKSTRTVEATSETCRHKYQGE